MHASLAPRPGMSRPATYVLAAAAVAAATWIELVVAGSPASALSLTILSLAIAVTVWFGGLGPGLLAVGLAAVAADLVVIEPGVLLGFTTPVSGLVLSTFIAEWAVFSVLANRVYRRMREDATRRAHAEQRAARADRMAQLTAALGNARTPAAAIEATLVEPVYALRADSGAVFLVSRDGAQAHLARAVGYPEGGQPGDVSLAGQSPLSDAVGRGAPVWLDRAAILPLHIGSRIVAVAVFDFARERTFTNEEREYLEVLGTRGGQALDRTWQFEYAVNARAEAERERARADQELAERQKVELALRASEARGRALAARTSRLHGLTAALSESVTLDAVARAVVHQGRIAVGATTGEVTLLVDDGQVFETLYGEGGGIAPGGRTPVEPGLCATSAVRSREPVFVSSFEEWQERFPLSASNAASGGYVSSATVPLLVENLPIGVVAFYFTVPVNFDDEYRALLVSVAQHCAQALDRARLYESAQRAREEAEAANRLKDEFVSIASHELRAPLNSILGWTSMLMRPEMDPALTARAVQSVHDNASRQARLIEDLLDFSRLRSGRLALMREDVDVRDLLRGVVEALVPQAVEKGVRLECETAPATRVHGDVRRLEQVFFNLLGNALKFTPSGGRITVAARRQNGTAEVSVSDTGIGIEPDFLPFVFDRFRQSHSAAHPEYGGLGLGLSISRQLVEAHGGTIHVESGGHGKGATFTVMLPLLAPASAEASAEPPDRASGFEQPRFPADSGPYTDRIH